MDSVNTTTLVVKDFQGVKIHTFVSPYAYAANATHIIETANELVIVDTQFINLWHRLENYVLLSLSRHYLV